MTLAHDVDLWEVARKVQRLSASHKGIPLTDRDSRTHAEAIALACCHLVDLRNRKGFVGPDREVIAWAHFVRKLDTHDLGTLLAGVLTELRKTSSPRTLAEFKRSVGSEHVHRFIAPATEAFRSFVEDPRPYTFTICNQFISFLYHLSLQDIDFDVETEYKELEESLPTHFPDDLVDGINNILKEWLNGFSVAAESFNPRHGKGAVATLTRSATLADKYRAFGTDSLLSYVFKHYGGIDVTTYMPFGVKPLDRTCDVVSVPKSVHKRRIISKEPAFLQFLQQGIRRLLYAFLEGHWFLKDHVTLRDQRPNQILALEGSRTGRFATIDMSAASDRITVDLVKRVFHNTNLLPFLVGTRSRSAVLPSGEVIGLRKFAPMGSALCFPVQTLIFAACVEYSVRRARAQHMGYHPVWHVYGDDIVVADVLYDDVVLVLEALGFKVNALKSYHSPARFRESCGVEAYDGVPVQPLRIPRSFYAPVGELGAHHSSLFEGMIDLANAASDLKFPLLRTVVLRKLLACKAGVPLFSRDGRGCVKSTWPDNYRAPRRFDKNYQAMRLTVARPATRYKGKCLDDGDASIAYLFETLRLSERRTGDMFLPEHRIRVERGSLSNVLESTDVFEPPFEVASRSIGSVA